MFKQLRSDIKSWNDTTKRPTIADYVLFLGFLWISASLFTLSIILFVKLIHYIVSLNIPSEFWLLLIPTGIIVYCIWAINYVKKFRKDLFPDKEINDE